MLNECEIKQLLADAERKMWAAKDNCEYCREVTKVRLLEGILGYKEGKPIRIGEDVNPALVLTQKSGSLETGEVE